MTADWKTQEDADVVRFARVIPLDVVQAKGAGHAGTAVSLTPALYVLFQEFLRHNPADAAWHGRDRFVLSCGHASLALYLQLYLSGYGLEMDDLRSARTIDSRTPGHPEFGHTVGVETTTGPLGQGIGNAVGIAMEAARLRNLLGTDLYSPRVWCFASDGDIQEGISHEASSLAGTLQLDDLILIWDDNAISIEGDTAITFTEDVSARYRAYGWTVLEIADAEDPAAIRETYRAAEQATGPVFIRLRSRLGHPMPQVGGTAKAHSGAPGEEELRATKTALGLDPDLAFQMPSDLLEHARRVGARGAAAQRDWTQRQEEWARMHAEDAALVERLRSGRVTTAVVEALEELRADAKTVATRVASSAALNRIAPLVPELWGGSADLAESNGTQLAGADSYLPSGLVSADWPGEPGGQLVHFGIREHAMGAILNGIALGGLSRPFGATFFVFSDYMRPAVRLAALMRLPVTYVWSHDSVAVGEDGPTHQPIEQLWSYRAIVGLSVVRPADWVETVDAWRRILTERSGPVALVLSRQTLPVVAGAATYQNGASRGGYVIADGSSPVPDAVIIATGSEVSIALAAAERLEGEGLSVRVVSMPCIEWFEQQPVDYRDSVLPPTVDARVSVEAGTDTGWHKWVGRRGRTVAIDSYGQSGAGDVLLARLGITVDAVVAAVRATIADAPHEAT